MAPGVTTCLYAPAYRSLMATPGWFAANHPDWVMRKADRSIAWEFGNTKYAPLDISNPAVVKFLQAEMASRLLAGQSWLCIDNVDGENGVGEVGRFDSTGAWVAQYTGAPGDAKWSADNIAYLRAIASWAHGRGIRVMVNDGGNSAAISAAEWEALAAPVDGVLKEGWPIDGCADDKPDFVHGYVAGAQYDLEFAEAVAVGGKPNIQLSYFCGVPLSRAKNKDIAWVTATRLLTMTRKTGSMMAAPGAPPLTDDASLESYPLSMNPPIGPMIAPPPPAGGPYKRAFAHGFVALNRGGGAITVTVPAGADQFGAQVPAGRYTLAPLSGGGDRNPLMLAARGQS